jgi:hypothetical protein
VAVHCLVIHGGWIWLHLLLHEVDDRRAPPHGGLPLYHLALLPTFIPGNLTHFISKSYRTACLSWFVTSRILFMR